jgi:hypothetical protein
MQISAFVFLFNLVIVGAPGRPHPNLEAIVYGSLSENRITVNRFQQHMKTLFYPPFYNNLHFHTLLLKSLRGAY